MLPSEFATSSNTKLIALLNNQNQTSLPMIQGSGKFSYAVPILPKPKQKPEDSFFRSKRRFRRSTTIQYYEQSIGGRSGASRRTIVDVKFPHLPHQKGGHSPMNSSGKFSVRSRSNASMKKSTSLIVPSPATKTKVRAGSLAIADDLSSVNDRDEAGLISQ